MNKALFMVAVLLGINAYGLLKRFKREEKETDSKISIDSNLTK